MGVRFSETGVGPVVVGVRPLVVGVRPLVIVGMGPLEIVGVGPLVIVGMGPLEIVGVRSSGMGVDPVSLLMLNHSVVVAVEAPREQQSAFAIQ